MIENRFTTGTKRKNVTNTFIILSAGVGRRMGCYGPKCLLKHGGESLINRQIAVIKKIDTRADIILVVGFQARKVIAQKIPRVRVIENVRYDETNAGESLRLAMNAAIASNVYVLHGDLVLSKETLTFGKTAGLLVDDRKRIDKTEVGVVMNGSVITNLSFGLPLKWGQVAYFPAKHFLELSNVCNHTSSKNKSTFEIINTMIDRGVVFQAMVDKRGILKEIDSSKDLS